MKQFSYIIKDEIGLHARLRDCSPRKRKSIRVQ